MNRVEEFYDAHPEYEWSRLDRHRVEYGLTLRAMEEHLPRPPASIIDVGGGVGKYAIELARRGYEVTLVDLSAKALAFAQVKAKEAGASLDACIHADARDLSGITNGPFDAALHMGPLYHLLERSERVQSLRELCRLLRPGGKMLAAFVSRYSAIQYAAMHDLDYVSAGADEIEGILKDGVYLGKDVESWGHAWFAHPSEIAPLMSEGGFEQVDLLHCEPLAFEMEDKINAASPEIHRQWLDLLYRLSRDPSLFGAGGHLLYVGRRV